MFRVFLLVLFLVGCQISKANPNIPEVRENAEIREEIAKMDPQLAYCDGVPVHFGKNSVTGREDCNSGDSMLWAGLLYNARPTPELAAGIRESISPEGRPYRSPENRRGGDVVNTFSRDMWLGFLAYCQKSKDFETCNRVWSYTKSHDYRSCPVDTDERCFITPSILYVTGYVWQSNGWHVSAEMRPSGLERYLDEQATIKSANQNDIGYELHLISVRMYLQMSTGFMTGSYKSVVKILSQRVPQNLWYRYLEARAYGLDFSGIENELVGRMSQWQKPTIQTGSNWEWQNHKEPAMGHDFVFLGCQLLGGC